MSENQEAAQQVAGPCVTCGALTDLQAIFRPTGGEQQKAFVCSEEHAQKWIAGQPATTPVAAQIMRLNAAIVTAMLAADSVEQPSRELALCKTKLEEAVMWLGRVRVKP